MQNLSNWCCKVEIMHDTDAVSMLCIVSKDLFGPTLTSKYSNVETIKNQFVSQRRIKHEIKEIKEEGNNHLLFF